MSEKSSNLLLSKVEIAVDEEKNIKNEKVKLVLSENAIKVIEKRYLIKDKNRKPIETPEDMFRRVAHHIAQADLQFGKSVKEVKNTEDEFFNLIASLDFLPNSPSFTGAGTKLGQLSACFVLPVEDDMHSILRSQMYMGLIHKSGGGTGFSFSRLRPKNDVVGSTGGIASGPVGFMQMYNDTTEVIKQGGTRRGANMGILRVDHPDILDFIDYKETEGHLSNFNISVGATSDFMNAVIDDGEYSLLNPNTKEEVGKLKAKEVWEKIVQGAWRNGEPGIIFLDKINEKNPTPNLGEIESTNPCGEQPLLPYESCNLGSINLAQMVKENKDKIEIDWDKLEDRIKKAMHFLDNVIDVNKYPIPEIKEATSKTRKVGLGIMGFADLLFQLEIPYNSDEAFSLAEKISKFVQDKSHLVSQEIAKERGEFPAFKGSVWDKPGAPKMRNAATTTIAPTGTLSIIATTSSGIEPIFALVYTKTVMDNDELVEVNRYFKEALKKAGIYSDQFLKEVAKAGSIQNFDNVPDKIKKIFVTSQDISPVDHVKMQAAFQKYTDNAISKTINFPNSAIKDDIEAAYLLSYKLNCKGITVYRDGSRSVQILTTGTKENKKSETDTEISSQAVVASGMTIIPRERPEITRGFTYRVKTAYGKLYITINNDENGKPFEVFSHLGKAGGFFAAKAEAICRLISLALRSGIDPEEVISQLKGIRGPTPTWSEDGRMILSLPDAIAHVLEKHVNKEQPKLELDFKSENTAEIEETANEVIQMSNGYSPEPKTTSLADLGEAPACPECGAMLELGEGCLKCVACGYSKCA